jgi:chromosome segregation ATPase
MGGSKDELMILALDAKATYDQKFREYREHELLTETLKMSLVNRKQRWAKFRRYITIHAKGTFTYLLSERQFRGVLGVRHGEKELDISVSICFSSLTQWRLIKVVKVEPDITRKQDTGRETRTLSGGEKSFSTICLLLSLWDAMGSPIRCLDEL